MSIFRLLPIAALLLTFITMIPPRAASAAEPDPPILLRPAIEWRAEDVVRIVIEALARNDQPYADAGIATTFNFASPNNRRVTGPLGRFGRMVKAEPYGLMVGHVLSEFGEMVEDGDDALQRVKLTAADGRSIVYAFKLSRQRGGAHDGMWMTEAVWPIATDLEPLQAL